eukprot:CAMPEP_0179476578 /NCGR_PEP_ID=MMETSP0799-20121207/55586_1 /TAXON_ID=46947 /ORGANISM="Geminigera cryophila, Strain CCMP2564" /LENGTH=97 /DNA_ID=CAMNT_0021286885 /DNA_START=194 /DNA_END=484 /DNA_ORIENTATION=-
MTRQKRQMAADVQALSARCVGYKDSLRQCQAALNTQNIRLQALYQMAQAMALSLFQQSDLPLDYHRHFVGYIYQDILRAHTLLIRASSRLQKVFRGH